MSGVVPRPRITGLLDAADAPSLVWISGPAGSGKTTLTADYLDRRSLPSLWYQVDESDGDLATFFYYLGLAARRTGARRLQELPLLTPEYLRGVSTFARHFFEQLWAGLRAPHAVVLDNYQEVASNAPLHEALNLGLATIPDGLRVFVLSRQDPPPVFARLRVSQGMRVLGWEDVRFTLEESARFLGREGALPDAEVAALHAQTEGWAAGLVLCLGRERSAGVGDKAPGAVRQPEVFDYFAGELFDKLDAATGAFLLALAFLPSFTVRGAEEVTGRQDAGALLADLDRKQFFTARISGPVAAYRFHPLFRAFLAERAEQTLTREALERLRGKSAQILLDEGHVEEAATQLHLAGNWAGLAEVVLSQARPMIAQGRNRTLREWIQWIPADIVSGQPWLLYWSAICILLFDPAASRGLFERALELFERREDRAGALLTWSGLVQSFLIELDDFHPLDRWIAWFEARQGEVVSPIPHGIEASVVSGVTGIVAWRKPDLADRARWLERALTLKPADLDACLRAYTNCALYHAWVGDFAQCGLLVREMNGMMQGQPVSPLRQILCKITEAMLRNSSIDHRRQAREAVSEGLRIAQESGVQVVSPTLHLQGAFAALNEGDLQGAREHLGRMEGSVRDQRRINLGHYFFLAAWCELLGGEPHEAVALARRSRQLIEAAGAPFAETLTGLALALALHEDGGAAEARALLDHDRDRVARTGSTYAEYLHLLLQALWLFEERARGPALQCLARALGLGRRQNFVTMVYFWRPAVLGRLCGEALAAGIEVEHVGRLIDKLGLVPEDPRRAGEHWPWRLKVLTLGRFRLLRADRPVPTSGKAQVKPLLMLKSIVAAGPKGIHREQVIDALWPDAEGDAGQVSFHTTLSRLRRLVGDDRLIRFQESTLTLDRSHCWVDAWAFEEEVDELAA
ncbi:MAG: hypothetical protein ACYDA8_02285, partial [Deferrisomatales bacterium]